MKPKRSKMLLYLLMVGFALPYVASVFGQEKTLLDEWGGIKVPDPPELKQVTLDPKTTAFLVLDIQKNSCTPQARPRCVASIPKVKAFLELCRQKGVFVAHSLTSTATPQDIVEELTPLAQEPVVRSGVDKFYKTDLEKILTDRGIKTVIIAGTAAHGAVLHTATGASLRGLNVVVPVDGMSADVPFAELYTAWHLLNSPGTRRNSTVTSFSRIQFQ
ncbi:MAG: cysteine hydrolase [Spirochaetes bacterium]|nr:cysteine hydrolase [Spirochaetota bacterium]